MKWAGGVKDSGMELIGQVRASVEAGSEERSRGSREPLLYPEGVAREFAGRREQIILSLSLGENPPGQSCLRPCQGVS